MLGQRLRRWPNIKTSLFERILFAGSCISTSGSVNQDSRIMVPRAHDIPETIFKGIYYHSHA